jgi:hypothetical protein
MVPTLPARESRRASSSLASCATTSKRPASSASLLDYADGAIGEAEWIKIRRLMGGG